MKKIILFILFSMPLFGQTTFRSFIIDSLYIGTTSGNFRILSSSSDIYLRNWVSDKDIYIQTNDGGTITTNIFIDGSTSYVGMGDVTPDAQLDVYSTASIVTQIVDAGGNHGEDVLRANAGHGSYSGDIVKITTSSSASHNLFNANNLVIIDNVGELQLSGTLEHKKGSDIASAATITLGAGNVFDITGTTNIDSVDTASPQGTGSVIWLRFDGALTFTDGKNIQCGANITTGADDVIGLFRDSNTFICIHYKDNTP